MFLLTIRLNEVLSYCMHKIFVITDTFYINTKIMWVRLPIARWLSINQAFYQRLYTSQPMYHPYNQAVLIIHKVMLSLATLLIGIN